MKYPLIKPALAACCLALASVPAAAEQISFEDQIGRQVTLDGVPKSVVSLARPAPAMVLSMAQDGSVMDGMNKSTFKALKQGVFPDFFPEFLNASTKTTGKDRDANIEEILRVNPDIVLQWGRAGKSIKALEAAGLKVAALRYTKDNIAQHWLRDLGIMFQQSDRVKEIFEWHDQVAADLKAKVGEIPEDQKQTVLYMRAPNEAAGPFSHFQKYVELAGLRNILEDSAFVEVDAEMILLGDPDVIWLFGPNPKVSPKMFYENPIYTDLKAVKSKRIYKVPLGGARWDPPNQESPLAWEWYVRTAHPKLLDGSIRESITAAYPLLYGQVPTDAQMDRILRMDQNAGAADYDLIAK